MSTHCAAAKPENTKGISQSETRSVRLRHVSPLSRNWPSVGGFADPVGSRKANILLSELRAQVVVDRLETIGVNSTQIRQRGRGSVQFALTSQESRRVEISFSQR